MSNKPADLVKHDSVRDMVARLLAETESLSGETVRSHKGSSKGRRSPTMAVFLFSSVRDGQGTSTIAEAVALALTESGKSVVLAVVGRPEGDEPPSDAISLEQVAETRQPIVFEDASPVTLTVPPRYSDLSASVRSPESWAEGFDFMILDAPSLNDSLTQYWAPKVRGVVLVLDGEQVSVRSTVEARDDVVRLGAHLIGVVLNRFESRVPRFIERFFI